MYIDSGESYIKKEKSEDGITKRIRALRDRQTRNKISKKQKEELATLLKEKKRVQEKRKKKGLDNPKVQKELKKKAEMSEAVINHEKVKKNVKVF